MLLQLSMTVLVAEEINTAVNSVAVWKRFISSFCSYFFVPAIQVSQLKAAFF